MQGGGGLEKRKVIGVRAGGGGCSSPPFQILGTQIFWVVRENLGKAISMFIIITIIIIIIIIIITR